MPPKNDSKKGRKRKEKIPVTVRNSVWSHYMGPKKSTGMCFCCSSCVISQSNFIASHVQAESLGGRVTIQNLRPTCMSCSSSMGTRNMEEFMEQYGFKKNKYWNGYYESRCIIL